MMTQDITTEMAQILTGQILKQPNRKITPDTKLISSGLVDSFHLVDLALMVEDKYGVHIDDAELNVDTFDTLAQLVDLICQRMT
jgi:acyl carrier protein